MAEGIVYGMPLADYIRDPAPEPSLSPSIAHTLLTKSARHGWWIHPRLNPAWAPEEAEQLDVGTIAHGLLLEGDESRVVVIQADDFRTKLAREARDDARAHGKLPILAGRWDKVRAMVDAAREAIAASELAGVFADGDPEVTMLWRENGIVCRTRPDWMSRDRRVLVDYKSTAGSAEPDAWARGPLQAYGYDLQAAFGLRALQALAGQQCPAFVFIVQEIEPPYAVSFVSLAPAYLAWAEQKRRHAVNRWAHCIEGNVWPGYPSQVAHVEPPGWAMAASLDRMGVSAVDAAVDDGRPLADQLFGEGGTG